MADDLAPGPGREPDPAAGPPPRRPTGGFAQGGPLDTAFPGAKLARALERASGPQRGCEGASEDEIFGIAGRWDATEAWAASAKLGVIYTLLRRRGLAGAGTGRISSADVDGLAQELSNQLAISVRAAADLAGLAVDLHTRLLLTREALQAGVISMCKARIIADATAVLDDERAAAAETLVAAQLAGKTPGQVAALIGRAVVTVDPDGARKRRERAQKEEARVRFWREQAGTAALAAFGLPPDEALAANQNIQARAQALKAAGMKGSMDQLRVRAFLDALTGADSRPAASPDPAGQDDPDGRQPASRDGQADGSQGGAPAGGDNPADSTSPDSTGPGLGGADRSDGSPGGAEQEGAGTGRTVPEGAGTGGTSPGSTRPGGPGAAGTGGRTQVAASIMLTVPLFTLLGLAQRPGEAAGWGAVDPSLARQLAAAAARHPATTWCLTVTDAHGHAIAHGCARLLRTRQKPGRGPTGSRAGPAAGGSRASPSVHPGGTDLGNSIFPSPGSAGAGNGITPPEDRADPGGGYGSWQLRLYGRDYVLTLHPIPVTECDHQYQTTAYRPGRLLRHLVEVRDGQCTQPTCARPARRCDFEHAVPWDKGGKTCTCNGGCRCRRDHQVKQSPGWTVTQPQPGYHQWITPAGRSYTSEPMRYPV